MNINRKYLGEAILFTIQLVAAIAIGLALLSAPIILALNLNSNYFLLIYLFYGIVFMVKTAYSSIIRGEYLGTYANYEVHGVISEYKGAHIIDERAESDYKSRVFYNKETKTITLLGAYL
jgi:hypothetical protein